MWYVVSKSKIEIMLKSQCMHVLTSKVPGCRDPLATIYRLSRIKEGYRDVATRSSIFSSCKGQGLQSFNMPYIHAGCLVLACTRASLVPRPEEE